MLPLWCRVLVVVGYLIPWTFAHINEATLYPNQLASKQVIYPNQPVLFELYTVPDQPYEVKLSYRATSPSRFHMRILDSNDVEENIVYRNMRRVLNTVKTFVRGIDGKVFFVEVSMKVEGISHRLSQSELDSRRTEFDILLEEVVFNALPRSAVTLIFVALSMLALSIYCIYPQVVRLISSTSYPTKLS